jgi:hypothetical protein
MVWEILDSFLSSFPVMWTAVRIGRVISKDRDDALDVLGVDIVIIDVAA